MLAKRARVPRDQTIELITTTHLPALKILRALNKLDRESHGPSVETQRKNVHDAIYAPSRVITIYGKVCDTLEIKCGDKVLSVDYAAPAAFLRFMSQESSHIGTFIENCLRGSPGHVCIYADAVTPGNPHRPETSRKFQAIYWTIIQLPLWYRTRSDTGWFPLAYVPCSEMEAVGCSMSVLMKKIIHVFFGQSGACIDIAGTGFHLVKPSGQVHVQLKFGFFMADDAGLWEILNTKGVSGSKPCLSCSNVVGRIARDAPLVDGLVHFTEPDHSKFEFHTTASYTAAVERLDDAKRSGMQPTQFQRLEQCLGIKYDPESLLWDVFCRATCMPPLGVFWDWQHNLVSSGGLAQYEVNQFVRAIVAHDFSLEQLDEFKDSIRLPGRHSTLSKHFFAKRIVSKDGSHMKAFASEMLTAVMALGLFCDAVLKPVGILPRHVQCFDCLRNIVDILMTGDAALDKLNLLRDKVGEHHALFMLLYSECAKQKIHYMWHVVFSYAIHKISINCFVTERKHKKAKGLGQYCYNKLTKTALVHDVFEFHKLSAEAETFASTSLRGRCYDESSVGEALSFLFGVEPTVRSSARIRTSNGDYAKSDLVVWSNGLCHSVFVGFARLFLSIVVGNSQPIFFAFIERLAFEGGSVWSTVNPTPVLVEAGSLKAVLPYHDRGCSVRAALPTVLP